MIIFAGTITDDIYNVKGDCPQNRVIGDLTLKKLNKFTYTLSKSSRLRAGSTTIAHDVFYLKRNGSDSSFIVFWQRAADIIEKGVQLRGSGFSIRRSCTTEQREIIKNQ